MTELWQPVVGYEGLYEVSDQGRVKSLPRLRRNGGITKERILRATKSGCYHLVSLHRDGKREAFRVHQLVAAAFLGPCPDGLIVLHGSGGKTDNRPENLSYGTYSKNKGEDRVRDGTSAAGERHHTTKVTAEQVREIRALRGKVTQKELGARYGMAQTSISFIQRGLRWVHLD